MKITKVISSMAVSITMLSNFGIVTGSGVKAATKNNNVNNTPKEINPKLKSKGLKKTVGLTRVQVNTVDKYVKIKNNKYTLTNTNKINVSKNTIKTAKESIKAANKFISQNRLAINSASKSTEEILPPQQNFDNMHYLILSRRRNTSHYTYRIFWWGTRYYFRSNAAVAEMDHDLTDDAILAGTVGTIGALFTEGYAEAVGVITTSYFEKLKNDLDYMNSIHPHSYLYMDVDWTGLYKIKAY